jgi:TRAP-type uncharacterized transport system substrate-binding protein
MIKILFLIVILIILFYVSNKFLKRNIKEGYLTYFLPFYNEEAYNLSNFYLENNNNKNYFKKKFNYDHINFGCVNTDYYFIKNLVRYYIANSDSVNASAIIYKDRLNAIDDLKSNKIAFCLNNYGALLYNNNLDITNIRLVTSLYREYIYFFTKKKYSVESLNNIPVNFIIGLLDQPNSIFYNYHKVMKDIGYTENIDYKTIKYNKIDNLFDAFSNDEVNMIMLQEIYPSNKIYNYLNKALNDGIILLPFEINNEELFFKKNTYFRKTAIDLNLLSSSYLPIKFKDYSFNINKPDMNILYTKKILLCNKDTNSIYTYSFIKFIYENYKTLNNNNVNIGYNIDSIGIDNYNIGYLEYHPGVQKYFNEISLITNIDNENCKYLIGNMPCNDKTLKNNNFLLSD